MTAIDPRAEGDVVLAGGGGAQRGDHETGIVATEATETATGTRSVAAMTETADGRLMLTKVDGIGTEIGVDNEMDALHMAETKAAIVETETGGT
mmetsp:Transcript_2138/g.4511  ORF Transcript_2138/g.4511 Transcript_2138/m.4511 type:complete len:94 (+) Transcript_2138:459-740(+)